MIKIKITMINNQVFYFINYKCDDAIEFFEKEMASFKFYGIDRNNIIAIDKIISIEKVEE